MGQAGARPDPVRSGTGRCLCAPGRQPLSSLASALPAASWARATGRAGRRRKAELGFAVLSHLANQIATALHLGDVHSQKLQRGARTHLVSIPTVELIATGVQL